MVNDRVAFVLIERGGRQPGAESAGCSSEQGAIPEARAAEDGNITER
jgi:hypothetical protein